MNLLPETEKKRISKGLSRRFFVLISILISVAFIVGTILLVPSYIMAKAKLLEVSLLAQNEDRLRAEETEKILAVPEELESKTEILGKNIPDFTSAEIISSIIKNLPGGVVVDSISLSGGSRPEDRNKRELRVSGISANRQALIDFSDRIRGEPTVGSVDVPVSSLTRERNLPFSIKIILDQ